MKGLFNGWLDLWVIRKLSDFVKKEQINLIHTNLVRADIYGRIASKICVIPILTTVHNTEEHHTSKKITDTLIRYIDKKTISRCDRIITVSYAVKNLLHSLYRIPLPNFSVIQNGIDMCDHISPLDRRTFGIDEKDIIISTVARLHKQKGIHILVNALDVVVKKGFRVTAIIVGDGPLKGEISSLISKLNLHVLLVGFQKDVFPFIALADLFVLPSLWEGFGLSILEAMSLAKAVVATNVGGIPEIVEDEVTGILCAPGDVLGLAAAIVRLIRDAEQRKKMGELGRRRVGEYFRAEEMSKKYQQVYKEILASNSEQGISWK
jgi:glycosyltransferase involved in cell wall biosynthesis